MPDIKGLEASEESLTRQELDRYDRWLWLCGKACSSTASGEISPNHWVSEVQNQAVQLL